MQTDVSNFMEGFRKSVKLLLGKDIVKDKLTRFDVEAIAEVAEFFKTRRYNPLATDKSIGISVPTFSFFSISQTSLRTTIEILRINWRLV